MSMAPVLRASRVAFEPNSTHRSRMACPEGALWSHEGSLFSVEVAIFSDTPLMSVVSSVGGGGREPPWCSRSGSGVGVRPSSELQAASAIIVTAVTSTNPLLSCGALAHLIRFVGLVY
jgi:hypothetical protein